MVYCTVPSITKSKTYLQSQVKDGHAIAACGYMRLVMSEPKQPPTHCHAPLPKHICMYMYMLHMHTWKLHITH